MRKIPVIIFLAVFLLASISCQSKNVEKIPIHQNGEVYFPGDADPVQALLFIWRNPNKDTAPTDEEWQKPDDFGREMRLNVVFEKNFTKRILYIRKYNSVTDTGIPFFVDEPVRKIIYEKTE